MEMIRTSLFTRMLLQKIVSAVAGDTLFGGAVFNWLRSTLLVVSNHLRNARPHRASYRPVDSDATQYRTFRSCGSRQMVRRPRFSAVEQWPVRLSFGQERILQCFEFC